MPFILRVEFTVAVVKGARGGFEFAIDGNIDVDGDEDDNEIDGDDDDDTTGVI